MIKSLKAFQKRLTNLSSNNKSLVLQRCYAEQFFDVNELNFVSKKPSYDIINQLIAQKKQIFICDEFDPRHEKTNQISRQLKRLARTQKFIEQERGTEDLYIGYPFVKGKLMDGTVLRCPLLFFPVSLLCDKQKWYLQMRDSVPVSLNRSFLLAYAHYNQTKLNEEILDQSFEDFSTDSLVFLTELFEWIKKSGLALNFNQELFAQQLSFFDAIKMADLQLQERTGELKLYSNAVLGIFPQAGSYLVPDYEVMIQQAIENEDDVDSDLSGFFKAKLSTLAPEHIKEERILAPFAIDASQEKAIRLVDSGHSLQVQGPPGTGKSQLICNVVADAMATGKRVLVVCQKRAALDVVYERMNQIGLASFIGLVHDYKQDRKELYQKIADQIEAVDFYKKQNYSLNALKIEEDFKMHSRQIQKLCAELDEFKTALFDESLSGFTIKYLYLHSQKNSAIIDVSKHINCLDKKGLTEFLGTIGRYDSYYRNVDKLSAFWQNRTDYSSLQSSDLKKALTIAQNIYQNNSLKKVVEPWLAGSLTWGVLQKAKVQVQFLIDLSNSSTQAYWPKLSYILARAVKENSTAILLKLGQIKELIAENKFSKSVEYESIGPMLEMTMRAKNAYEGSVSKYKYLWFAKEKNILQQALNKEQLSLNLADILKFIDRLTVRKKIIDILEANQSVFSDFIDSRNFEKGQNDLIVQEIVSLEWAVKQLDGLRSTDYVNWSKIAALPWAEAKLILMHIGNDFDRFHESIFTWHKYFTESQCNDLFSQSVAIDIITKELYQGFDTFFEIDRLKNSLVHWQQELIDALYNHGYHNKSILLQNSVYLQWIEIIEDKYPILRSVSSPKILELEASLQQAILSKQDLSKDILHIKCREHTYNNLEMNRLHNITTYRELKHQVTKKKKIWPIRQLINNHSVEIFDLVPCWLASPETVSAVFPMQQLFDLVIFDEASQCYAESGLPALYRAKQCLITGDRMQLQPYDLYQVRFDPDTEELPDLEVSSLLDLASQYLPTVMLNGHYRSKSAELIHFSNINFYKNKLSLIPDFKYFMQKRQHIFYHKVDGVFENSINEQEADYVVDLIKKLVESVPEASIGVVCFNYQQQQLISDKIDSAQITYQSSESLFVKNIENVQGDERDIIIFSVGYAPDANGKIRMQFGSLNTAGGENRLNVAITRARAAKHIVCSIWPEALKVENTLHAGPKLLREYLEYVQEVSKNGYTSANFEPVFIEPESLIQKLILQNPSFKTNLPFADITDTEQYNLVLTDDNNYFQAESTKDSHAYKPMQLQAKGWQISRKYSRNFWNNIDKQ